MKNFKIRTVTDTITDIWSTHEVQAESVEACYIKFRLDFPDVTIVWIEEVEKV